MAEQAAPAEQPAAPAIAGPSSAPPAAGWTFDLARVSRKEYSDFRRGKLTDEQDNELLARASGMSVDMIAGLPLVEFRRLVQAFYKKATEPLADPN